MKAKCLPKKKKNICISKLPFNLFSIFSLRFEHFEMFSPCSALIKSTEYNIMKLLSRSKKRKRKRKNNSNPILFPMRERLSVLIILIQICLIFDFIILPVISLFLRFFPTTITHINNYI